MNKIITIFVMLMVLSGCSAPLVVENRNEQIKQFHPSLPTSTNLSIPKWFVLTPKFMSEYIKLYNEGKLPPIVYYGLTKEGYDILTDDMVDITKLITDLYALLDFYRSNDDKIPDKK